MRSLSQSAIKTRLIATIIAALSAAFIYAEEPSPAPSPSPIIPAPSTKTRSARDTHRWVVKESYLGDKDIIAVSLPALESKGPMFSYPELMIQWNGREKKFRVWLLDYPFESPAKEPKMQVAWRRPSSRNWADSAYTYQDWLIVPGYGALCDDFWTDGFVFRAMRSAEVLIVINRDDDGSTAKFDVSGFAEALEKIPAMKEVAAKIKSVSRFR